MLETSCESLNRFDEGISEKSRNRFLTADLTVGNHPVKQQRETANSNNKNHQLKKLEGEGRNGCTLGKEEFVSLLF